jgi:hypothetical protein
MGCLVDQIEILVRTSIVRAFDDISDDIDTWNKSVPNEPIQETF